jgi:hypothetical protein
MPAGLLPAFMARQHENLSPTVPNWRHGCVLELKECRVRVIADTETRRVLISVNGEDALRREALDQVRYTFETLHRAVDKLPVQELIPVPGRPDAPMLKYGYLRSLLWKGITEHEAEGTRIGETIPVNVREVLDGVRGIERRKQDDEQRKLGGDTHYHNYVQGDYVKGDKAMNTDSNNITIGGNVTNSQVGQTLTQCINTVKAQAEGERKDLLLELTRQVDALIQRLPPDKHEEVAGNLELMVKAATSAKPNRAWYSVSADGLLEATKWVSDFTSNITGTVGKLGKLLGF